MLCVKEIADLEKQLGQVMGSGSKKEEVLQKKLKKMKSLTRKQDKLLTVSFHILLNLAEDTKVEKKMKKMKVIPHLVALLTRRNLELRTLAVMFLKKLSIFRENITEMAQVILPTAPGVSNEGQSSRLLVLVAVPKDVHVVPVVIMSTVNKQAKMYILTFGK